MTTDDLDNKSDRELNELFAVEVARWQHRLATKANPVERGGLRLPNYFGPDIEAWWVENSDECPGVYGAPPKFTTDANAVLPWLEKRKPDTIRYVKGPDTRMYWIVDINCCAEGRATTFPRAACIALIRANRAEKSV